MANPRRSSHSITVSEGNYSPQFQTLATGSNSSVLSQVKLFLKKPHAFPFLLSVFLLLTWISLRFQNSARFSSPPHLKDTEGFVGDDRNANLVRFSSGFPSRITKDKRGWMLDPLAVAVDVGISGGAVTCASLHIGEIRPGGLRGNHRHLTCNETFLIWGAKTVFRLENKAVNRGYAEATLNADEVAVAASPHGTAHALLNVDPVRSTFFMGCQDSIIDYNKSITNFNVWKDL